MGSATCAHSADISEGRIIGHIKGNQKGPTLIFFGGIHGNEPAGVSALEEVFAMLNSESFEIHGSVMGIRGNIPALLKQQRFLEKDLNRLWTEENIRDIKTAPKKEISIEENELIEIDRLILELLTTCDPPFYFIDFHTTSSKSLPFITINDAMINRRFSQLFPVPIILGIEEFLSGPLLSHMNEMGYVSLGFESGMHTDEISIANNIAFTWLSLVFAGVLPDKDSIRLKEHFNNLKEAAQGKNHFYEVSYRHKINPKERFEMVAGFESFQAIKKGTLLALHDKNEVKAENDSILFMPLYQNLGEDGFFLIRKIPSWALRLSSFLRRIKFDSFLVLLPGISWSNKNKEKLRVNLKIARYFTKSFFHLLGYRNQTLDKNHLLLRNRERPAKTELYRSTDWFNGKAR